MVEFEGQDYEENKKAYAEKELLFFASIEKQ